MTPNPTQLQIYVVVQAFLQTITGLGQSLVIQGLPNRTAMPPASPGFVSMQIGRTKRLRTNVVTWDTTIDDPTSIQIEQGTEVQMQVDFYGSAAGDWCVAFEALWRDETGCLALEPVGDPLYTDEGQLAPLEDDEEQYEQHWTITGILQYNPVVSPPMQFADTLSISLTNVDEAYPP
jgi:hypothetical protein